MENTNDIKNWGEATRVDLIDLLLGKKLGVGMSREVYECAIDHEHLVVKIETGGHRFQNVAEWEVWNALKDTDVGRRWLAPCAKISICGTALIQARTEPLQHRQLPPRMPTWLTDFKASNFGLLKGRIVCHDYGTAAAVIIGMGAKSTTKAVQDWVRHG